MKNTITILILLIFTTTGCSNSIVLKRSIWEGNVAFYEGDEVLFIVKNQIDTLPKCQDSNNFIDSIKGLNFKTIHKIGQFDCSLSAIKDYKFDTLSRTKGREIEKQNKEYRKVFYQKTIYGDSGWAYIYKIPIYSTYEIVPYDSIEYIIESLTVTECDNYFQRTFFHQFTNKMKLYRWKIEKDKLKIKGKH